MAQANLKAIVTAQDSASPTLNQVANSTDKLGASVKNTNNQAQSASLSFGKLSASVAAGMVAYQALTNVLSRVTNFFGSSIKAANEFQGAMIGLATVASAFGQSAHQATEVTKSLAMDGLMTVNEAGTALKNLLATGFSLPEAIKLMTQFKDIAAFNRQGTLEFGQAIIGATIGIKNGNSIMVDNIGLTKNLSIILKEAGYSEQDLMKATSDASVRRALYNGLLKETNAYHGDAARLAQTFAGAQAAAGVQVDYLKQNIGRLLQAMGQPLLQSFTSFIEKNRATLTSLALAAGGVLIFSTAIFGLVKVGALVYAALTSMTLATGVLGIALIAVSAILGSVLYNSFNKVQKTVNAQNQAMIDNTGATKKAVVNTGNLAGAQSDLGDQIAKVNEQIERENRNFNEQLAEMIKRHQDKVVELKEQIDEETQSYKEAQEDAAQSHAERVDRISRQIQQEVSLGILGNQEKLADLRAELAAEEAEFQEQELRAKTRHEKKLADLQVQLNAETQLLQKHSDDVKNVRNVQLLDEIDKLKRNHQEQLNAYEKQKQQITSKSAETAKGVVDAFNAQTGNMNLAGSNLGAEFGRAFKSAIGNEIKNTGSSIGRFFEAAGRFTVKGFNPFSKHKGSLSDLFQQAWDESGFGGDAARYGRATGGYISPNTPYIWNEQGKEMFISNQGGRMVPADKVGSQTSQSPLNITINAQAFVGSQQEARKFAQLIMNAYNDLQMAKGM